MQNILQLMALLVCLACCLSLGACDSDDDSGDDDNDNNNADDTDDDDIVDDDVVDDDAADDDAVNDDAADDDVFDDDTADDDMETPVEVWAIGNVGVPSSKTSGFFWHYQNEAWTAMQPESPVQLLLAVSCSSTNRCRAITDAEVLMYEGGQWVVDNTFPTSPAIYLRDMVCLSDEVWVVGADFDGGPRAWRQQDQTWESIDTSEFPQGMMHRVKEINGRIYTVGGALLEPNYQFVSYLVAYAPERDGWQQIHVFMDMGVEDFDFAGTDWGIGVGSESDAPMYWGVTEIYNQGQWTGVPNSAYPESYDSAGSYFTGCAAMAPGEAWVVGYYGEKVWYEGGYIYHLQNGVWSEIAEPWLVGSILTTLDRRGDEIWAAGYITESDSFISQGGVVARFHDGAWQQVELPDLPQNNYVIEDVAIVPLAR